MVIGYVQNNIKVEINISFFKNIFFHGEVCNNSVAGQNNDLILKKY